MNNNIQSTFTISSIPFYDKTKQYYKNILVVNVEPGGPLNNFVQKINIPNCSSFGNNSSSLYTCTLAIRRHFVRKQNTAPVMNPFKLVLHNNYSTTGTKFDGSDDLLSPDDIPNLMNYLLSNGYQIETQLSNMLNTSLVKTDIQKILFMATYYGNTSANITYMR